MKYIIKQLPPESAELQYYFDGLLRRTEKHG